MLKKICMLIITIVLLLSLNTQTTIAKNENYSDYIQVINNETKEVIDIEIKEIIMQTVPMYSKSATCSTSNSFSKEVKIEFDIPELRASNQSISKTNEHGDFVANIVMYYETAGSIDLPKIKITSVTGGWKCTATNYTARFENREVLVKQGNWFYDDTLVRYPTTNTFLYAPGWGFVDDLPKTDYSGAYALSSATAIINGMGGGYTLNVSVAKE